MWRHPLSFDPLSFHLVKIGWSVVAEIERGGAHHMVSSPLSLTQFAGVSGSTFLLFESGLIALRPDGGFVLCQGWSLFSWPL